MDCCLGSCLGWVYFSCLSTLYIWMHRTFSPFPFLIFSSQLLIPNFEILIGVGWSLCKACFGVILLYQNCASIYFWYVVLLLNYILVCKPQSWYWDWRATVTCFYHHCILFYDVCYKLWAQACYICMPFLNCVGWRHKTWWDCKIYKPFLRGRYIYYHANDSIYWNWCYFLILKIELTFFYSRTATPRL
jgi:hypothetical protein